MGCRPMLFRRSPSAVFGQPLVAGFEIPHAGVAGNPFVRFNECELRVALVVETQRNLGPLIVRIDLQKDFPINDEMHAVWTSRHEPQSRATHWSFPFKRPSA